MLETRTPTEGVRYEKSDANVKAIFGFAAGLVCVVVLVCLGAGWLFAALREGARGADVPLPTLAARERVSLPRDLTKISAPRLQRDEGGDLKQLRRRDDQRLSEYGWIDAEAGVVHVPIGEAMRLLADPNTAKLHGIHVEGAKKKGGQ
jgi:hypothetical protein